MSGIGQQYNSPLRISVTVCDMVWDDVFTVRDAAMSAISCHVVSAVRVGDVVSAVWVGDDVSWRVCGVGRR